MIRSMTGFARAESDAQAMRLSWEIRSVNHRYLDTQFKLPEEFRALEPEWRAQAAACISRGKVECALRVTRDEAAIAPIQVDAARLRSLKDALDVVARTFGAAAPDPIRALSFPGVLMQSSSDLTPQLEAARTLFVRALEEFNRAREREGARAAEHLKERALLLQQLAAQVRARYPQVRTQWIEKLRARCADLGVEVEPQRLAQEVAIASQRLDVDEELSRLASHLVEVRSALSGREPAGRRLDFLMQELNRETNTIASKSQDAEMTKCAVDMKVAIEQMREQVQNIE
ncbi:MAG: YicC/YloC family endoribonuclease [Pseudomonadota bacterium]